MRTIIAGSRDFSDYTRLSRECQSTDITEVISGGARGADSLAIQYAEEFNIPYKVFYAAWNVYGKRAGYVRNAQMITEGQAEQLVAFWDGSSKGTKHMINLAEQHNLKVTVVII